MPRRERERGQGGSRKGRKEKRKKGRKENEVRKIKDK